MVHDRIDALPASRRLTGLAGELLDREFDAVLQGLVEDAARQLDAPIALVSMVLDNIQFFRAQHGLPDDLAEVRATARDVSFCQFVVRDDELIDIPDARGRPDVPQALVDAYGIRAYLGAPIHLGDQPLGSLCVIDTVPRAFTPEERALVSLLAQEVERRIAQWSRPVTLPLAMIRATASPIFAEMRTHLTPLVLARDELHLMGVELTAQLRGVRQGGSARAMLPDLDDVERHLAVVGEAAGWVDDAAGGLAKGIGLLEGLVDMRRVSADAQQVVRQVEGLSKHSSETVGGVSWAPVPEGLRIALPIATTTVTVAAVLNWLIGRIRRKRPGGVRARVLGQPGEVIVEFTSSRIEGDDVTAVGSELDAAGYAVGGVSIEAHPGALRLILPGARGEAPHR